MVVLAVNERGEAVARIALDSLPDIEHRAASRVDHDASDLTQHLEILDRDAEGGQDHDVFCFDAAEIDVALSAVPLSPFPLPASRHKESHPNRREFRVHVRVM